MAENTAPRIHAPSDTRAPRRCRPPTTMPHSPTHPRSRGTDPQNRDWKPRRVQVVEMMTPVA